MSLSLEIMLVFFFALAALQLPCSQSHFPVSMFFLLILHLARPVAHNRLLLFARVAVGVVFFGVGILLPVDFEFLVAARRGLKIFHAYCSRSKMRCSFATWCCSNCCCSGGGMSSSSSGSFLSSTISSGSSAVARSLQRRSSNRIFSASSPWLPRRFVCMLGSSFAFAEGFR